MFVSSLALALTAPALALDVQVNGETLGETMTVQVSGCAPGATVALLSNNQLGGGFCPAQLAGQCVDLPWRPAMLGAMVADGGGVASLSVALPQCTPWASTRVQAVQLGQPDVSEALTVDFQPAVNPAWPTMVDQPGTHTRAPIKDVPNHWDRWLTSDQVAQLDVWYREGTGAGLEQDTFQSWDGGHSAPDSGFWYQMSFLTYFEASLAVWQSYNVESNDITWAVQSFGWYGDTRGVPLVNGSQLAYTAYSYDTAAFEWMYTENLAFVAPSVDSYRGEGADDKMAYMSPYYLISEGMSYTDVDLSRSMFWASAALHPELKTRLLDTSTYVPTLQWLLKRNYAADYRSAEAHKAAYDWDVITNDVAWAMVLDAHELTHMPPMPVLNLVDSNVPTMLSVTDWIVSASTNDTRGTVELTLDASRSYADNGGCITEYSWTLLRGTEGVVMTPLTVDGSRMHFEIPWQPDSPRTDVVLIVNDGTMDGPPAYVSIDMRDGMTY